MRKKRWLEIASGAAAIVLVVAAVAWVVFPDRTTPGQRGGTLSAAGASTGLSRVSQAAAPQGPALEPKTANGFSGAPQAEGPGDQVQVDATQTAAGQVIDLPPMVPSSWGGDLRTLPPGKSDHRLKRQEGEPEINRHSINKETESEEAPPLPAQEYVLDEAAQTQAPDAAMPSPLSSFLGLTFATWGDGWPPDTNGDVGPTYYIQTVNTSIGIFNKSTGALTAAFSFDTLMSQGFASSHPCYNKNYGDPVVVWDPAADRWFISDFAFAVDGTGNPVSPTYECIAVSQTSDPVSGGWYFYALSSSDYFADYPKMGIWPDGLYITANMFSYTGGGSFQYVRAWALNKTQMIAGQTASVLTVNLPASTGGVSVFTGLPSTYHTVTGAPPTGRENFISVIWSAKVARVWKWHVDWMTPANSTFTGPSNVTLSTWNVSPATVAAQGGNALDTLQERLMMQAQYTNIGGVESLWLTHSVANAGAPSLAAPRWYQINVTGGTVVTTGPLQQSTWAPDTSYSRWMGSLAVDKDGNMALGYSRASASAYPAIYYAGRLASDPASTLGQTETLLHQGNGYQCCTFSDGTTNTRWGDYSAMTIDPDGCTFWYTTEYYDSRATTNAGNDWQTRIGSFRFPTCTPPATEWGTLQGTVTNQSTGAPISGATVTVSGAAIPGAILAAASSPDAPTGSLSTTTNASGFYQFTNVPVGVYSVSATAAGYNTATTTGVTVANNATTTQDEALTLAPLSACQVDTTRADFQAGAASSVDLTTSAGNVLLVKGAAAVDQQQTNLAGSGFGFSVAAWQNQTFVPSVNGFLTRLDVALFCSNCTGTTPQITVEVRNTTTISLPGNKTGYVPGTTVLASTTIPGFSSGVSAYYTASFNTPAVLTSGTHYAYTLRVTTAPSTGTYAATTSNNDQYNNGTRVSTTNSGTNWTVENDDLGFRTYMSPGYVASGTLASSDKDANPLPTWDTTWTLSWAATTPANTSVRFQVAASNSASELFSFVGPDGTASTYFTASGTSLGNLFNKRYVQYKAYLATTNPANTPTLSEVSLCYDNAAPTAVDLARFEAWPEGQAIHVRWETISEIDTLGFNLYRGLSAEAWKTRIKLNEALIPTNVPPGSPFGAVYDWIDAANVHGERTYYYWLEAVDTYGGTQMHGPIEVTTP